MGNLVNVKIKFIVHFNYQYNVGLLSVILKVPESHVNVHSLALPVDI